MRREPQQPALSLGMTRFHRSDWRATSTDDRVDPSRTRQPAAPACTVRDHVARGSRVSRRCSTPEGATRCRKGHPRRLRHGTATSDANAQLRRHRPHNRRYRRRATVDMPPGSTSEHPSAAPSLRHSHANGSCPRAQRPAIARRSALVPEPSALRPLEQPSRRSWKSPPARPPTMPRRYALDSQDPIVASTGNQRSPPHQLRPKPFQRQRGS